MRSPRRSGSIGILLLVVLRMAGPACGADGGVAREERFEFAEAPSVARAGDRIEIRFAASACCDATVVVEDGEGHIVRHLAGGVLGGNAPAPFAKGSLKQALVWDGKDDTGRYIDDKDTHTVRVSLGLKPQFERVLYWSPYKRISAQHVPLIAAVEDGVLVYDGEIFDSVRMYDHDGRYVRTVYPFPANKVESVTDLHWADLPGGPRVALREGHHQSTLLSSGENAGFDTFGLDKHNNWDSVSARGNAASGLAAAGRQIALASLRLNRLAVDGSTGGLPLNGPAASIHVRRKGSSGWGSSGETDVGPSSLAFSPDGKRLYLAGYGWSEDHGTGGINMDWIHGVAVLDFDAETEPKLFAGSLKQDEFGTREGQFRVSASVAVAPNGEVFVADYMNDRVQVFSAEGKFLRAVAVSKPASIAIHPGKGELYVFSWPLPNSFLATKNIKAPPTVTRLGPLSNPKKLGEYPLDLSSGDAGGGNAARTGVDYQNLLGLNVRAALDPYAAEPRIWVVSGKPTQQSSWDSTGVRLYSLRGGRLEPIRDFAREALQSVAQLRKPTFYAQRLAVEPRSGRLFVCEGSSGVGKSFSIVSVVEPDTGKVRLEELPFDTEDLAFDTSGHAYLRGRNEIVRYDPVTWREVPWDYGVEAANVSFAQSGSGGPGLKRAPGVISGLHVPLWRFNQQGGIYVSAKGNLAFACRITTQPEVRKRYQEKTAVDEPPKYVFDLFPGRSQAGLVAVVDKYGKTLYDDALPGVGMVHGVGLDNDDNIYLMAAATDTRGGKPHLNTATDTLLKVAPRRAKILCAKTDEGRVPVPLTDDTRPQRPTDLWFANIGPCWMEGVQWAAGGVGFNGRNREAPGVGCDCWSGRFALDYLARSFAPDVTGYGVLVLDANGNRIVRVGRYANADSAGPDSALPLGGDEVGLFYAPYVATHTDKRLFIADTGNQRVLGVKLGYHMEKRVALKDVPDAEAGK